MKCRGCGKDTREFESDIGWMHYRCEIERLSGLYEEAQSMLNSYQSPIEMIYLAAPYSHPSPEIRELRFITINNVAARMINDGQYVYSPISHSHPIAVAGGLPVGWGYWGACDRKMISICTKLIVLMLDGWEKSVGVAAEIKIANEFGIPVEYISES